MNLVLSHHSDAAALSRMN